MPDRIPAEAFPPGEFIKDEMEARGWTQGDLAAVMNRPIQMVNEVIVGRKAVTPETACNLAAAFGTSAEFWLNLESSYRLHLHRQKAGKASEDVAIRGQLYELAPVKEMVKRQWIPSPADAAELEGYLNKFYGCRVRHEKATFALSAKKSTTYGITTPTQTAWACRARQLANAVSTAKFDHDAFVKALPEVHKLVAHEANVRHVPRMLAEFGVRFVLVERLTGSRMDGAAFWLTDDKPVVALSLRFDRVDHFWFTLAHELAHIVHRDEGSIDEDMVGEKATPTEEKPEDEKRADLWAANYLLSNSEIEKFILRVRPLYSKKRINQFANRVQVHPGIIVGQLQRRDEIPYSHSRELLVKVRDVLTPSAMSDGWGTVPSLD